MSHPLDNLPIGTPHAHIPGRIATIGENVDDGAFIDVEVTTQRARGVARYVVRFPRPPGDWRLDQPVDVHLTPKIAS